MRRPEVGFGPLAGAEEAGPEPALLEQPAVPDAEARVGGEGLGNVGRVGEGDADGHGSEVSGQLGRRPVMGRSGERDPGVSEATIEMLYECRRLEVDGLGFG